MACLLAALDAEVEDKGEAGEVLLRFEFTGAALDEAIERLGAPPLPPYIASRRALSPSDSADYQTMFATKPGAVAAPTAGLHFTPALVARLAARGVALHRVTLHVGAGTFAPVRVEDTRDHKMHSEWGSISAATAEALNAVREAGGPDRLRRHDVRARPRKRCRRERAASSVFGPNGYFHHPRLSVSLCRRAPHQLSSAAIDALHARFGVQRAQDHARGLCARHSSRLPVLFLRRRLPLDPRGSSNLA